MPLNYEASADPHFDAIARAMKRFDDALSIDSDTVKRGLGMMARPAANYASAITHQDTATLWRSYVINQDTGSSGAFASVYVDPSIVNPRGQRPANYAFYEFARGGSHDAFGRTAARAASYVNPAVDFILNEAAKKAKL
jgi:hypothetical protein